MRFQAKRAVDLAVGLLGLVAASPVLACVAALARWRLGTPVLFRQVRPGLDARPFTLIKFRTMRDASGPDGQPLPDDQRMTRLGRTLRATSLDELPELWNVVRGDMSLVGPRPLLTEYLPLYNPRQARRHDVRPGITGWSQVNGRNTPDWDEKLEMDVWYVENRSMSLDLRILARTVRVALLGDGVSREGHVTSPRFAGSLASPSEASP